MEIPVFSSDRNKEIWQEWSSDFKVWDDVESPGARSNILKRFPIVELEQQHKIYKLLK